MTGPATSLPDLERPSPPSSEVLKQRTRELAEPNNMLKWRCLILGGALLEYETTRKAVLLYSITEFNVVSNSSKAPPKRITFLFNMLEHVEKRITVSYQLTQISKKEQFVDEMQVNAEETHEKEEKYGLFRNEAAKEVLHFYLTVMCSRRKDGSEEEVMERSIMELA